ALDARAGRVGMRVGLECVDSASAGSERSVEPSASRGINATVERENARRWMTRPREQVQSPADAGADLEHAPRLLGCYEREEIPELRSNLFRADADGSRARCEGCIDRIGWGLRARCRSSQRPRNTSHLVVGSDGVASMYERSRR